MMNRRGLLGSLGSLGASQISKPLVTTSELITSPKKIVTSKVSKVASDIGDINKTLDDVNKPSTRRGLFKKVRSFMAKKAMQNPQKVGGLAKSALVTSSKFTLDPIEVAKRQYLEQTGRKKVPFSFLENFNKKSKLIYI